MRVERQRFRVIATNCRFVCVPYLLELSIWSLHIVQEEGGSRQPLFYIVGNINTFNAQPLPGQSPPFQVQQMIAHRPFCIHALTIEGLIEVILEPLDCLDLPSIPSRSEEHTSELQSRFDLVCRLLL